MAKPRLVRPEVPDAVIAREMGEGPYSVAAIQEKYGKTRGEVRSIEKRFGLKKKEGQPSRKGINPVGVSPPALEPPADAPAPPKPVVGRSVSQIIWGIFAVLLGLLLGAAGIILNCQYWYAVGGGNQAVSLIFCAMGGAVDGTAVAIPSWAVELWKKRNYALSGVVVVLFVPVAIISLIASAGFSGTNIGDARQARIDAMASKEDLKAVLEQKKAARASVTGTDLPDEIEIRIQDERGRIPVANLKSSNECTDTTYSAQACWAIKQLRRDKIRALSRVNLDAEIRQLTKEYEARPSIASKDPASERVSQMTAGFIRPETVLSYLINAMAAAPIMSGLFFAVAAALLRR